MTRDTEGSRWLAKSSFFFLTQLSCSLSLFWGLSERLLPSSASPVAHRSHVLEKTEQHLEATKSWIIFKRLVSLFSGWFASHFLSWSSPVDTQNYHDIQ